MNWSNESPSDTCRFKNMYDNFTENMINHNLEQMVKIPTRNSNILDLYLTKLLTRSKHANTKTQTTFGTCLKLKLTGYPPYTYQQEKLKVKLIYRESHTK